MLKYSNQNVILLSNFVCFTSKVKNNIYLQKPDIDASSGRGETPLTIQGAIEFTDVEFSYPTRLEVEVKY